MLKQLLVLSSLLILLTGCETPTPYVAPPEGDPAACETHHVPMKWDKVKIWYGLPSHDYRDGVQNFPHSGKGVCGGCMVRDQKYCWRWVCDECTKSEDEWHAGKEERSKRLNK